MRKLLLSTASLLAMGGVGVAADLPSRKTAPSPVAPIAISAPYSWTGGYVGYSVGYGWSPRGNRGYVLNKDGSDQAAASADMQARKFSKRGRGNGGPTFGGQVGYNYQIGQFVLGGEADVGAAKGMSITKSGKEAYGLLGSVRARVGIAVDRTLVYATGGVAYSMSESSYRVPATETHPSYKVSQKQAYIAPVAGGGIEYAFSDSASARIEGLYYFGTGGRGKYYGFDDISSPNNRKKSNGYSVFRVGMNYKF